MKLPSLWLVGAFAAGVLCSRTLVGPSRLPPIVYLGLAAVLLLTGALALQRSLLIAAGL